jgi:hypothetical protein
MKLPIAIVTALTLLGLPALIASSREEALSKNYEAVDANKPVVCLLPGRVRKVGGIMTYLERRKPAEMTASECEIRGGEYTLYDRANYVNALAVWRQAADQGDATAQVFVGEIYEKGWVGKPDYVTAAQWYAKAAAQKDRRAQRRLAYFYENGLGVEQSQEQALALWRTALDLKEDLVLASAAEAAKSESQKQIDLLVAELEQQNIQTGRLQRNLDEVQTVLASQGQTLQRERSTATRLTQELARARVTAGDPTKVRQLEQQLAAGQSRIEEQGIAIELLEADSDSQKAQVAASARRADVRGRQLARAQTDLLAESSRGDALLLQLQDKDQTLKALEQKVALAETQLQESRNRQQQLTAKVDVGLDDAAARAELETQLQLSKQEVANRENRMQALRQEADQQRTAFEQQLAKSEVREADLNAALQASRQEKEKLSRSLNTSTAKLASLETELTKARYALADKEAATASLREQLNDLDDSEDEQRQKLNNKIRLQEKSITDLQTERDKLIAGWKEMAQERNEVRTSLASQLDTSSWLDVELESASTRLATTRDELRTAEIALGEANFAKMQLTDDVSRLAQDLATSRERGHSDRKLLKDQLRQTRALLAEAGSGVDNLRQEASRLESDFELYGDRQQARMLAMRGLQEPTPVITDIPKAAKKAKFRAIIIANYEYDFMPDLSSPPFDANELKQLLENAYGFNVEVLINLNRSEMYKALGSVREFSDRDYVLLYYAGHGKMDEYGDGYWLPTDYRTTQPLTDTISSGDLTQTMNQSGAKHLMVIADSCYSGALARNADPVIRKSVPALMNYWMANRSRTVLTSGGLKPVLDEGPGNHSVFAGALLQVLKENSVAINGEMLHAQVHDLVRQEAARLGYLDQKPQFAAIEDAGHENGQFVFLRSKSARL